MGGLRCTICGTLLGGPDDPGARLRRPSRGEDDPYALGRARNAAWSTLTVRMVRSFHTMRSVAVLAYQEEHGGPP
jgi:hypothetical protein